MDLIIGAGVSGISYANFSSNDFLILEKENEPGGYCRTIKKDGFIWDYSGHFFHFQHPEMEKYVRKNILFNELLSVKKHTQILYRNRYIDFPFQKNIHQLEKEEFVDCLYDLFFPENANILSFKDMLYCNFGKSIAEKFLVPYNEKLYACDLNNLDVDAMGRFFPKASKDDIIRNFRASDNSSYNTYFTYPKNGAMEYIYSLLANIDNTKVALNEELIDIDIKGKMAYTNKREIAYDNLISTIPFPVLLEKCGMDYLKDQFSCNKVLVFNLGFDSKGDDNINSWVYIPSKDFVFYRVGYYDNIIGGNRMSLYVEIGFPEKQDIPDSAIYLDRVLEDLMKAGIITTQKLVTHATVIMSPAYVHINKKSVEAIQLYKAQLDLYNIYSIGRYGSWTYCSIEDNILEAKCLAEKMSGCLSY